MHNILALTEKYATHPNIKNIKNRIDDINSNFSFKSFAKIKFLKKLKT